MHGRIPRLVALLPIALAVLSFAPILSAQPDLAARLAEIKTRDGFWVVRCSNGEAMGFDRVSIQGIEGTTISFKPKWNVVRHATYPAGLDSAQERAFAELFSLITAPDRDSIGALPVHWTGPYYKKESPACNAEEVLHAPVASQDFERPREYSFANVFGGSKMGSMVVEYVKKPPKTKATVCLIRKPPANPLFPNIAPDLESAFFDQVKQHMASRFEVVGFDDGTKPSGAARVLVFDAMTQSRAPSPFKNKPPYLLIDAVFHLDDAETGRLIWQGRSGFPIGDERDKDIRKIAKMFGCL